MSTHHISGSQTALVGGPAKIELVADNPPVVGTATTPTVTSLSPNTAVAGAAADVTLLVNGTGFNEFTKIVFNGLDEPTTLMSPTQLRTIVRPSLFLVPAVCPVGARNGSLKSGTQNFTFT